MKKNRLISLLIVLSLIFTTILPSLNSFVNAAEDIIIKDDCTDLNKISCQSGNVIVHDGNYFIIDPSKPHMSGELIYKVPLNSKVTFSVKSYGTDVFGWKVSGSNNGFDFTESAVTDNKPSTPDGNGWYNYDITLENVGCNFVKIEYPYIEDVWSSGWAAKVDKVEVTGEKTSDEFVGVDQLDDSSNLYDFSGGIELYNSEAFQKYFIYKAYVEYDFEPGNNLYIEGCIKDKGVDASRFEVYSSLDGVNYQKQTGVTSDSIRDNYWLDQKTTYENLNAIKVRVYFPPEYNDWFAMLNQVIISKPKYATLLYEDHADSLNTVSKTSGNIVINGNDFFMQDEADPEENSFIEYKVNPGNDFVFNGLIGDKGEGHQDFVVKGSNDGSVFEEIICVKITDIVSDYWAYNTYYSEDVNYSNIRIYFPSDIKNWAALIDFVASYEKTSAEDIADGSGKYLNLTSNILSDKDSYDKFYKVAGKDIGKNYLVYDTEFGAAAEIIVRERSELKIANWQFKSTDDDFYAQKEGLFDSKTPNSASKYKAELANRTFIKREGDFSYYKYEIASIEGKTLKIIYPDYSVFGKTVFVESVKLNEKDVTNDYLYKSDNISSSFEQTGEGSGAGYITYKITRGTDMQFGTINFDNVWNYDIEISNDNIRYQPLDITHNIIRTDSRKWIYVNNYANNIDAQFVRIWFSDCNEKYDWHSLLDYVKFGKGLSEAYTDNDGLPISPDELKGEYEPITFDNILTPSDSFELFMGGNDFTSDMDGIIASSDNLLRENNRIDSYNGFIYPNKIPAKVPEKYGYITYKVPMGATVTIQFALASKGANHKTTFGIEQSADNIAYTHENVNYKQLEIVDDYWQVYQASTVANSKYIRIRFPKTETSATGWTSVLMKVDINGGTKTESDIFSGVNNFSVNPNLGDTYQVGHNLAYNVYTDPNASVKGYISDSTNWVDGWKANSSESWAGFKIKKDQSVRFTTLCGDKRDMYWLLEGSNDGSNWYTVNTSVINSEVSQDYWLPSVYTANNIQYEYLRIIFPYKNYNPDALWLTMLDSLSVANSEEELDGKLPDPGDRYPQADFTPITNKQLFIPSESDKAFLGFNDFTENLDGSISNSGNIQVKNDSKSGYTGFAYPDKMPDSDLQRYGYITYKIPADSTVIIDYTTAGVVEDYKYGFGIEQSNDNINYTPIKVSQQHIDIIDNYWNTYRMTATTTDTYIRLRFPTIELTSSNSNAWCAILNKVQVSSSNPSNGLFTGTDDFNTDPSLGNTYAVSNNLIYNAYTDPNSKSIGYFSDPNRWIDGWKANASETWIAYKVNRGQNFRFNVLNADKTKMYWMLQSSDDGINWKTVNTTITYSHLVEDYWQPMTYTANNIQGEYVRIVFPFKTYNPNAFWLTMLNFVVGANSEEELDEKSPIPEATLPEHLEADFTPIQKESVIDVNAEFPLFEGINDFSKDFTGLIAGTENMKIEKSGNGDTVGYILPKAIPKVRVEKYGYITYKVAPGSKVSINVTLANMGLGFKTTFGIEQSNDNVNFTPMETVFEKVGQSDNYWLNAKISGKATMQYIRIRFPSDIKMVGNSSDAWTRKLNKVEVSGTPSSDTFAGVNDFTLNPSLADTFETSHNLIYTKYTDPTDEFAGYFSDNFRWTDGWKAMAKESFVAFKIKEGQSVRISTLSGDKTAMYWQLEGSRDGINWYTIKAQENKLDLISDYWSHSIFTANNVGYEFVRVVFPYKNYNPSALWLTLLDSIAVADDEQGLDDLKPVVNLSGLGPVFDDRKPTLTNNTLLTAYRSNAYVLLKYVVIGSVVLAIGLITMGVLVFVKTKKKKGAI